MSLERILELDRRWEARVREAEADPGEPSDDELAGDRVLAAELLESMLVARQLDVAAHQLRASGEGHYTICSAGHEANVVLGRLTTPHDPSVVHYRSAALQVERSRQVSGVDAAEDIAASLVAARDEPTSGGRHKVFGGRHLGMIPSTSTIASHLPRALGLAFALERRRKLGLGADAPADAIALASFGDASLNHSTALGAINAAGWSVHQNLGVPLLLVCEDNGLGISVRTPEGWVRARLEACPGFSYFHARGWDLAETWRVASQATAHVRRTRRPALLHLECVRLLGHAGSDVDTTYRSADELAAAAERDPVTCAAIDAIRRGVLTRDEVLGLHARARERVAAAAQRARTLPRLDTRAAVMRDLATPMHAIEPAQAIEPAAGPTTLAQGINAALASALAAHPGALVFGEDVAKKGGVYGLTKGLLPRFGPARVFNTLLDEQTILGLALGCATLGLLPIPEIQYLAYLHNAEDQLRGEAATMQFFSRAQYDNPMLVRVAGLAYQKGFGGHFHNDDAVAVLRDIPGLVVGVPARGDDAREMYATAVALAQQARRVVVMIEPIALYHTRDLAPGDAAWLGGVQATGTPALGARVYHPEARDLVIATYGNGLWLSLAVAARLARDHGLHARVLDLRWLAPLPTDDVVQHALDVGKLLLVDECRRSGSPSEALAAALLDRGARVRAARVTSADSFIPLGDAAQLVLVSEAEIEAAALALLRRDE